MNRFKSELIFFSDYVTEDAKAPVSSGPPWPDLEKMQKMTFDLNPRDPKFKQCSSVYSGRNQLRLNGASKATVFFTLLSLLLVTSSISSHVTC